MDVGGVGARVLRVRPVVRGEAARLRELRLASLLADPDAFGSTHARDAARPPEWWARAVAVSEDGSTQRTFVVTDDRDRWFGLALVRRVAEPGTAELNAMWVASEARRRGAALALCDAAADWARSRGCTVLRLAVVVANAAALRTYEAAGFDVVDRRTEERDGRVLEELILSRRL